MKESPGHDSRNIYTSLEAQGSAQDGITSLQRDVRGEWIEKWEKVLPAGGAAGAEPERHGALATTGRPATPERSMPWVDEGQDARLQRAGTQS